MTTLDQIEITDTSAPAFVAAIPESRPSTMARSERIAIHLAALRSFFDIRNHSVDDSDPQTSSPDEWKHKIEIARAFTLRCIELIWVAGGQPDISAVEVVEGSLADLCDESSLGEPDHDAAVLYEIADSLSLLYDQLTIAGKAE